jgi:hypothetical protein
MFRPAGVLTTPVAPTATAHTAWQPWFFYVRASRGSLPPHAPDMLAVRIGQLTAEDFHLIRCAALSAAPRTPRHQARRAAGAQRTLFAVACMPLLEAVLFIVAPTLDNLADTINTADTSV